MAGNKELKCLTAAKKDVAKIFIDTVMLSIKNDAHAFINNYDLDSETLNIMHEMKVVDMQRLIDSSHKYIAVLFTINVPVFQNIVKGIFKNSEARNLQKRMPGNA